MNNEEMKKYVKDHGNLLQGDLYPVYKCNNCGKIIHMSKFDTQLYNITTGTCAPSFYIRHNCKCKGNNLVLGTAQILRYQKLTDKMKFEIIKERKPHVKIEEKLCFNKIKKEPW